MLMIISNYVKPHNAHDEPPGTQGNINVRGECSTFVIKKERIPNIEPKIPAITYAHSPIPKGCIY